MIQRKMKNMSQRIHTDMDSEKFVTVHTTVVHERCGNQKEIQLIF